MKSELKKLGNVSVLSKEQSAKPISVVEAVAQMLENLGVKSAFGVSGGAIAPLWAALSNSSIPVLHFRHESGASFAAMEAYFASNCPVAVFTTTGPGITNALTGLLAARWEGAKVILLSGSTSAAQRGRWGCQETSSYRMPQSGLFESGSLFDYATVLESDSQLPEVARRLAKGLAQPGGFVAHLSIPSAVQSKVNQTTLPPINFSSSLVAASEQTVAQCARLLQEESFAIWVGFGARKAAASIRQMAESTGAVVMCSPRAKGIFPENHPQFVGVTGFGGHVSVLAYMQVQAPKRILVLGTRLGEPTSSWNPVMVPEGGFIHVDIDPEVPGTAYPEAETLAVQSDVGLFVKALLKHFPQAKPCNSAIAVPNRQQDAILIPSSTGKVRPQVLMQAIQQTIVEGSDAIVMSEAGNSFAWAIHTLRFDCPGRHRVSTGFGSMGHFVTGVVGAALENEGKAVAIVGDGAMLMNGNEVSTAAKYRIPAVWIVLNDAAYNMCEQGMAMLGFSGIDTQVPHTDFAAIAQAMGADSIRVDKESDLKVALEKAMASTDPFVVDVQIDPTVPAPLGSRIKTLVWQGSRSSCS